MRHFNRHILRSATESFCRFTDSTVTPYEMQEYQNKYNAIVLEYRESPFKVSSSIQLNKFKPFQEWLPSLIENKSKVVPLLVCNMLEKDIYALNIYETIQKSTSPSAFLSMSDIHKSEGLLQELRDIGGSQTALAVLNAEHWLMSKDAADIALTLDHSQNSHESIDSLCAVIGMLGITNSFMDCFS